MRAELERLVGELTRDWQHYSQYHWRGEERRILARTIKSIQAILTRSDWIPVIERLPDEGWIWVVGLGGHIPRTVIYFEPGVYGAEDFIAWQPIEEPAPYRGEGGE